MALEVRLAPAVPVAGVALCTLSAGVKSDGSADMVVVQLDERSRCAAVFTRNAFCAAPVIVCKEHLQTNRGAVRALLINSGNANAGTGEPGLQMAREHCRALAMALGVSPEAVLPFSTGVIGQLLPDPAMRSAIARAGSELAENNDELSAWTQAAHGIMTTDTQPKLTSQCFDVAGETVTITGMAKGAGMIQPDMATMLAYVFTDAAIEQADLDEALRRAVAVSFNAITVDSDTSTNDSLVLVSTGVARKIDPGSQGWVEFNEALVRVCTDLAKSIVRDAEGATKFISVYVNGGKSVEECRQVGYAVANSPLVKTAMFASDANVGRLLMAIGKSGVQGLDTALVKVYIGDVLAFESGGIAHGYTEDRGAAAMAGESIDVTIELGRGVAEACIYTCDLSHDYVSINADYRS